jgi:hypothetical protein
MDRDGSRLEAQELLIPLVVGGVFARRPELRIVFAEFDVEWVPHLFAGLDHHIKCHGRRLPLGKGLDQLPSHCAGRSLFLTAQGSLATGWPTSPKFATVIMEWRLSLQ